jgi:large subunit ribosomal protein L25
MTTLQATKRTESEKLAALRASGKIPAVVYGGDKDPVSIVIERDAFKKAYRVAGTTSTIELETDGDVVDALVHQIQIDPGTHQAIHIDFLRVDKNKPIEVEVPLEFVGVSPAVKGSLGVLEKMIHELRVEALPKDMPHQIEIDLSRLTELGSHITVGDLKLGAALTIHAPEEEVIATITAIKEEIEESAQIDFTAIEVEKKGKKEESET